MKASDHYARFKDELVTVSEMERLSAEAPVVPQIQPLEEVTI